MQVSKSGYYYWKNKPVSERSKRHNSLLYQVLQAYKASRGTYGSPRIYHELKARGIHVSLNTIAALMKRYGLAARASSNHKKTQAARNTKGFAANVLARQFSADKPNQKWVSDTTFIETRQGWLYLATIIDLFSRKVIGWSMSTHNNTELVSNALKMAVKQKPKQQPVILHSDQGSTYRAEQYLALFKSQHIKQSMSAKGDCYDNAVAESFFGTLKTELIAGERYPSREQARKTIFEYIELFYNRVRRHSSLNYLSPVNFEKAFYNKN
jgi:transposase InsO family protein